MEEETVVEFEVAQKPHVFDESFTLPAEIGPYQLVEYIHDLKAEISALEHQVARVESTRKRAPGASEEEYQVEVFDIPPHCIPIKLRSRACVFLAAAWPH